ncbi:hypothetical protein [Corynebacterium sp. A21]|uniref:hypothetical protein n=1 Tax=Corynebacterium sp. A21 TaxID=3457318 RepID=UPI003FD6AA22
MGRFTKMAPAEPSEEPQRHDREEMVSAPDRIRRLTLTTLPDKGRYARLKTLSIAKPAGPLRSQAIERAARVQAHTPPLGEVSDAKIARIIARFLYEEAVTDGQVDEQRALTRANVDRWLLKDNSFSRTSRKTYSHALYEAGRTLYPREFPARRVVNGPRGRATPAAPSGTADELYATAVAVPDILRPRLLLVLDLLTGAGLRSQEIREVTGTDITATRLECGREIVLVRVRRRGKVDRVVPVICPRRGHRLQVRAAEVGTGTLYPLTINGAVSRNAVNKLNDRLREYGFSGLDAVGLRNRWIMDMATTPGIPTAAVLRLAGVGDLRVLADQADQLPKYSPEQLAEMLSDAEEGAA